MKMTILWDKKVKITLLIACFYGIQGIRAQNRYNTQDFTIPDTVSNIYVRKLFTDSLSSSFFIAVKKEVKLHKHQSHTEQVIILDGEGMMTLGEEEFLVKKGDCFMIKRGLPHALKVSSKGAVKLISIQAPEFDGKDRIFINETQKY